MKRFRQWSSDPLILLCLATGLAAFVVQSGELGTSDTLHRLKTSHSWWAGTPPVTQDEYPEFGIYGRDGKLQSWYGIGQSLLLFPFDVIGTYIERLPRFAGYKDDPTVCDIFVSYCTNILVTVLTTLVCFRFLRQLKFTTKQAAVGVLALTFATTHLHYTQNMMENNYIFLLTLVGLSFQYEWLLTGKKRSLLIGSTAFGLNLLTRLTTGMDLVAGGLFMLLVLVFQEKNVREMWDKCRSYIAIAFPVYAVFGLLDRIYQYHRFGSFFNTYMSVFAQQARQRDPSLPANFPYETPFHVGFFGALFSAEKSIFLFDPLLILMILLIVLTWRRFSPVVKAYVVSAFFMLFAYISFYARVSFWSGDFAWGDRYVSTSAEFAVLLAVPLLLRYRNQVSKGVWWTGLTITAISTVVQLVSLAFWLPLEIYQMETFGHPTYVILLRMKNIVAFAFGKMEAWGLNTHAMTEDPWDYVHITTWNFFPFLLRRVGVAPMWVVKIAFVVWTAGVAALAGILWRLRNVVRMLPGG
jgi:hypothetical protein